MANVQSFGAVGDGEADDTEAIQRAVDSGIGAVFLPRGRYRITQPVVVDLAKVGPTSITGNGVATLIMAGAGPAIFLKGTHDGTASPRTFEPEQWVNERAPMVDAVEIVGAHPEALGIRAEGTMQATITRVVIRQVLHAIHLPGRNRNVIIANSHLYENRGIGVFLEEANLHQFNVVGSHISYNEGGGIVVRGGQVRNLHVGTSDLESNMSSEYPPTANILFDMREGSMLEGSIVGNTIQHNNGAPGSANIRMIGREGDSTATVGRISISDNAMSDVFVNIHLLHARGVSITGNSIWQGYDHNILVENSAFITLSANTFERNPQFGVQDAVNDLVFRDSEHITMTGDVIHDPRNAPAALTLDGTRYANISGLMIVDPEGIGLLMDNASFVTVSGSTIDAPTAVRAFGGEANRIQNNILIGAMDVSAGTIVDDNIHR